MRWSFTLPGQPPSWNDTYHIVKRKGKRGEYMSLAKKQDVLDYQAKAVLVIRSAKPSGWAPLGQVRIGSSTTALIYHLPPVLQDLRKRHPNIELVVQIDNRNIDFVREYVRDEGFKVLGEDLGDIYARKVVYFPETGRIRVRKINARTDASLAVRERQYLEQLDAKPQEGDVELF